MNGPSEFHVVGVLKDWDITDRLTEIAVPAPRFTRVHTVPSLSDSQKVLCEMALQSPRTVMPNLAFAFEAAPVSAAPGCRRRAAPRRPLGANL